MYEVGTKFILTKDGKNYNATVKQIEGNTNEVIIAVEGILLTKEE